MGFLSLFVTCINLLAWPIVAFGYPLCASIHAIETDSASDTRNLISYWIFLSLIYLVEQAFLKILEWSLVWLYIKLIVVFWLIIPRFEGADYAYNRIIHPYISMGTTSLIIWLKSWKEMFIKRDNFLVLAEKYIQDNGPEALEKLIAKELNNSSTLEVEEIKAREVEEIKTLPVAEVTEVQRTSRKEPDVEQNDTKDAGSRQTTDDGQLEPNNGAKDTIVTPVAEKKGMECKVAAGGEISNAQASKKVQREWTCAICQVTTQSETVLNSHLSGRKHRDNFEALKAKNQPLPTAASPAPLVKKTEHSNGGSGKSASSQGWKQKNTVDESDSVQGQQNSARDSSKEEPAESNEKKAKAVMRDGLKQVVIDQMEKTIYMEKAAHIESPNKYIYGNESHGKMTMNPQQVQGQTNNPIEKDVGIRYPVICRLCNTRCNSESDAVAHWKGRKHNAIVKLLRQPKLIPRPNSSSGASI